MSIKSGRSATKRPIKDNANALSAKPKVQRTEWELADERLDDALRQTFPASDAISITRCVRGS
jgi:hypothetical protein